MPRRDPNRYASRPTAVNFRRAYGSARQLAAICCALLGSALQAQSVYFPRQYRTDIQSLEQHIPLLASSLTERITPTNKLTYFFGQVGPLLIAQRTEEALAAIDSSRQAFAGEVLPLDFFLPLFPEEVVLRASQESGLPVSALPDSLISKMFLKRYAELPLASGLNTGESLYPPSGSADAVRQSIEQLLATLPASDSLPRQQARMLVAQYKSLIMARPLAVMAAIWEAEEAKRYIVTQVKVPVERGNRISALVVRQREQTEASPVVLNFSIYPDSATDTKVAKAFAALGYASVIGYSRGINDPSVPIEPFEHDADDAYDLIDWISRQTWSNQRVGILGGSYLGFSTWAAAKRIHPAVKSLMPLVSVAPALDFPMIGNVMNSFSIRWLEAVTDKTVPLYQTRISDDSTWTEILREWYASGRAFRALDTIAGRPNAVFQRWLTHPGYDGFWSDMIPNESSFKSLNIPVLTVTGYFDDDQYGAMHYYRTHARSNPGGEQYLLIGPFSHETAQGSPQEDIMGYAVDSVARTYNAYFLQREWLDYTLRSGKKPALLADKVNFQLMGSNRWLHVPTLAAMSPDTLTLFLQPGDSGSTNHLSSVHNNDRFVSLTVDLADRSDASRLTALIAGSSSAPIIDSILHSDNAVIYMSEPIAEDMAVSGAVTASIVADVNKRDMDVGIAVYEMLPDGRFFSLGAPFQKSLQRASYAGSPDKRTLLEPGTKVRIPINTSFVTSKKLEPGSRLVVVLGLNKGLDWQINYGSGKDVSDETIDDAGEPMRVRWYGDSWVKIPIIRGPLQKH